ncbi:hypothetical protein [Trichormus variabilis]|uniref:Uncharacterized protein n=1 Tax=Trichormus variabilis SAG 1403-4b TaxID=447716 RepID=A0A433UWX8_ANAVA|nr:hypothetical protein [Trichormus variabilis]MBD2626057.1 hypothetical protein [Trichormus variabilis FACHB-164]RUS98328.1 hypothetical protein DSM107003_14160 [Trichormus variabilis SAG 1403-4b]
MAEEKNTKNHDNHKKLLPWTSWHSGLDILLVFSIVAIGLYIIAMPSFFAKVDNIWKGNSQEQVRVTLKSQIIHYRKNRIFAKTLADLPAYVSSSLNNDYKKRYEFLMDVNNQAVFVYSLGREKSLGEKIAGNRFIRYSHIGGIFILNNKPHGVICLTRDAVTQPRTIQPFVQNNQIVCPSGSRAVFEFKMDTNNKLIENWL